MGQAKHKGPTALTLAVHAEIRGWMGKRNLSQSKLGTLAGIPKATLSNIIGTDRRPMDVNELEAICKVLGVSPERVVEDASRAVLAAEQKSRQSSFGLAAKHDPGAGADINDEDYF